MKNDFKPVAGHKFNLSREPQPDVNIVIDCEVLTVEPNKTLTYTWEAFGLESVVTWTLTPTASGTLPRMEQAGFKPDQRQALMGAAAGWREFLNALERASVGNRLKRPPAPPKQTERTDEDQIDLDLCRRSGEGPEILYRKSSALRSRPISPTAPIAGLPLSRPRSRTAPSCSLRSTTTRRPRPTRKRSSPRASRP